MLVRLENVGKEFGGRWIFRNVTVQVNSGDRMALIGRNGSGKTTLFELIEGGVAPDEGTVIRASRLQISRLEQIPQFDSQNSVRNEALKVFRRFQQMEGRLRELETAMAGRSDALDPGEASEYEELRLQMRLHGGYDYTARTEAALAGLGFTRALLHLPCHRLSSGQQNRLLLAQALLRPADLLLLDEPTNHLDLQAVLWLREYLQEQKIPFIIISHDRHFLDAVTLRTWEIEQEQLHDYPGGFTRARRLREARLAFQKKAYERQQEWKLKTEEFIRRNIAGQKTRQAQSRRRQLEKTQWVEKPVDQAGSLKLHVESGTRGGALTASITAGKVGYPGTPLIDEVTLHIAGGDRIGILGGNGSGKTTLLRTLVAEVPLLAGDIKWGPNNFPAYFSQNASPGADESTVYDCLRELDANCTDLELRRFAARFLFKGEDIEKRIGQLSGGERSRLALARLLFHPANVLILDEPTNHLDIASREALESALAAYPGSLLVVSHDLYFLKNVTTRFYLIRELHLWPIANLDQLSWDGKVRGDEAAQAPRASSVLSSVRHKALSKNERLRRERKLQEIETHIGTLEARKQELLVQLQKPDQGFSTLHEMAEQYQQLEEELDQLYEEWERMSEELNPAVQ